ncbi:MAG: hemolysin family protein [Thermodesulfobacteriota bacterium]
MTILIVVVALTILISSQCSLYEAVLYSTRMGTLEAEKTTGKHQTTALKMIKMKSRISTPLSAILILNTIANTAGATIAGMYASKALGDSMVPLFSVAFTLGILFFAEIIPKTMGAVHWRALWPVVVWPLTIMNFALYPFIFITQKISGLLTQTKEAALPPVTEEDILGTIRLGARDGEISQWESLMLHNIINLENMEVRQIMTPRTVVFAMDQDMNVEDAYVLASQKGFTRIPVYRQDRENIVGYVMMHDLSSSRILSQPKTKLSSITNPIMFVRENEKCLAIMTHFLKNRRHIAMVGDEYGGIAGLVTLEDLLETVLGTEIVDENDSVVDMQKMARRRMQRRFYEEMERELEKEEAGGERERDEENPEETELMEFSEVERARKEKAQEQEESVSETDEPAKPDKPPSDGEDRLSTRPDRAAEAEASGSARYPENSSEKAESDEPEDAEEEPGEKSRSR